MTTDIIVPQLGESVTEATVAKWFKAAGDAVAADEILVELETDKANLEVTAEAAGVLAEILVGENESVDVGAVLGRIEEGAAAAARPGNGAAKAEPEPEAPAPAAAPAPPSAPPAALSPAVRRLAAESGIDA
ncbi:MAG TPA: biotin/lipoyl-containing protein, partial [Alphaproteobacteria bacterium]